jgi:hypothetical protein
MRASLGLVAFASLAAGCATQGASGSRAKKGLVEPRDVLHPTCRTRDRLIAPAGQKAGEPVVGKSSLGWAIVWSEQVGNRGALRFLAVDRAGFPRGPSAEIVDRKETPRPAVVEPDGDGHVVRWDEGDKCYARHIDARGRPRGDVTSETCSQMGGLTLPPACIPGGGALRCKTHDAELVLPAGAQVLVQEHADDGMVIASDAAGLHLYALDCAAR